MRTFFWSAPVAFRRVALETPEWTSRDSIHHRQSVSWQGMRTSRNNCPHRLRRCDRLSPSIPRQQHGQFRFLGLTDTCREVCATAVPCGGLGAPKHPKVVQEKRSGQGPLSVFTVASIGSNPCPSALYQSCSAWYCSSAKNSMAGTERKAASTALGLHCLCIRVAGSSFLFLVVHGVIASTNQKNL